MLLENRGDTWSGIFLIIRSLANGSNLQTLKFKVLLRSHLSEITQVLIVLMPAADDRGHGRLARQTALSSNSCCESVTGQEEAAVGGHKQVARAVVMMQEAIGQRLARALARVPGAPWEKVR